MMCAKCAQNVVTRVPTLRSLNRMTQQPQVPQPEGQQPAPASGGSGFDASGFQKDLTTKTISVNNAWILTGLGGVLFIAVFLTWASLSLFGTTVASVNGTDDSFLYVITSLGIAAAGALVALRKIPFWGVAAAAAAAVLHLILALSFVSDASGEGVSIGIGLILTIIGTVAVIGGAVYVYLKDKVDFVSSGPLLPQQNNNQPPTPQGPAA